MASGSASGSSVERARQSLEEMGDRVQRINTLIRSKEAELSDLHKSHSKAGGKGSGRWKKHELYWHRAHAVRMG